MDTLRKNKRRYVLFSCLEVIEFVNVNVQRLVVLSNTAQQDRPFLVAAYFTLIQKKGPRLGIPNFRREQMTSATKLEELTYCRQEDD